MTKRRNAYFSTLKYNFQNLLLQGIEARKAYHLARNLAAIYAFHASTDHLTFITL